MWVDAGKMLDQAVESALSGGETRCLPADRHPWRVDDWEWSYVACETLLA